MVTPLAKSNIRQSYSVFMPILADYSYHVKTGHDSLRRRGSLRTPILWFEILFHDIDDSSLTYQPEHRCTVSLGMKHDTEQCQTLKARAAKFTQKFSMSSSSVGLWVLFTVALRLLAGGWTKLPVHSFVRPWNMAQNNAKPLRRGLQSSHSSSPRPHPRSVSGSSSLLPYDF